MGFCFCSLFIHSVESNDSLLLADSEDPDQTADVQADLGLYCPQMPKTHFHIMWHICKEVHFNLGPVVQSIISLMSLLVVKMLT